VAQHPTCSPPYDAMRLRRTYPPQLTGFRRSRLLGGIQGASGKRRHSAGSVVACPAAQFFSGGSLRFLCEPTDLGAERRPSEAAAFRDDLRASNQFVQLRPGFRSIGFLRSVLAGRDHQHAILRDAIAG
jgi:hypothetical protein